MFGLYIWLKAIKILPRIYSVSYQLTVLIIHLQLPQGLYNITKRGTVMPRLWMKVLRKPLCTDVTIAAHAIAWEPLCYSCTRLKVSQVFHSQEISITLLLILICLGKSSLNPFTKLFNFIEIQSNTIKITFWILCFYLFEFLSCRSGHCAYSAPWGDGGGVDFFCFFV